MTTQTTSFPWDGIPSAADRQAYTSRMVSERENPNDKRVFWGMSSTGNPALLIEYESHPWEPIGLPSFKYIKVYDYRQKSELVLELRDPAMRELFLNLCLDIIKVLQNVGPRAARRAASLRLEWWSAFLTPSRDRLSAEAQKGLIAELFFLQRDALAVYDGGSALQGWVGPNRSQRDFVYGQTFIEVKSKRSSANHYIQISSENQLNSNGSERLFLYVAELNSATAGAHDAFTLRDTVSKTRKSFSAPLLCAMFDKKLADAGYFDSDDYTDSWWSEGECCYYRVGENFPRISSNNCPVGVEHVKYQIDLDYCCDYLVDRDIVIQAMR